MKKITLFCLMLVTALGFSQVPTSSPPALPSFGAGNFVSYFSGNGDITSSTNAFGATGAVTVVNILGTNPAQELTATTPGDGFQFVTSPTDLSEMTHIYFNFYVNGSVDPGEIINVNIQGPGTNYNKGFDPGALGTGTWVTVDIPLSDFALSNTSRDAITNLQFSAAGGNGFGPIYFDNIVFYKPAANPAADATLSDLKVDGQTIEGFSSTTFDYTYEVAVGTTQVPTVTGTASQAGSGSSNVSVTPAGSIAGTTNIDVTAPDGTTTQRYTVKFAEVAVPTTAPPFTPSFSNASDYLPIFSSTPQSDAPSMVNAYAGASIKDIMVEGNTIKRLDVPNPGAGFQFVMTPPVDLSQFTDVFFHMWVPAVDPGEVVSINIIGTGANYNTNFDPGALGTGTWVAVSKPLSELAGSGDPRNNITNIQFTGAGGTDGFGPVYLDNIIFFKSGTLSNDSVDLIETSVFNNPTDREWTIKTASAKIKSVQVFNILGKQVYSAKLDKNEVNIPAQGLNTGIYIARVQTDLGLKTIKLLRK